MTHVPFNPIDMYVEDSLLAIGSFKLCWRHQIKFDEANPIVLFHLNEFNGLKIGDKVKIDEEEVDERFEWLEYDKKGNKQEKPGPHCSGLNKTKLVVAGFVKLRGVWKKKGDKKRKFTAEHIFCMLISDRRLCDVWTPEDSIVKKERKILLFWTEVLKKV